MYSDIFTLGQTRSNINFPATPVARANKTARAVSRATGYASRTRCPYLIKRIISVHGISLSAKSNLIWGPRAGVRPAASRSGRGWTYKLETAAGHAFSACSSAVKLCGFTEDGRNYRNEQNECEREEMRGTSGTSRSANVTRMYRESGVAEESWKVAQEP